MKKIVLGQGSPTIGITCCIHGDEVKSKELFDLMQKVPLKKGTIFLLPSFSPSVWNNLIISPMSDFKAPLIAS